MKKIFTILALTMISVGLWATSITVTQNVIDFGTLYLDEDGEAQCADWAQAELDYTLGEYVYQVWLDTITDTKDLSCEVQVVSDDGYDFWYTNGYQTLTTVWVWFYAIEPGDYEVKYQFWAWETWEEESKYLGPEFIVKAKVVDPNNPGTGVENVKAANKAYKKVINGQMMIIRGDKMYDLTGKIAQ